MLAVHRSPAALRLTPHLYQIHLSTGTVELYARAQAQAISTALELAERGAKVLRVARVGEW
jgi:hypothetical protein